MAVILGSFAGHSAQAMEDAIAAPAAQSAWVGIWKVQDVKARDFYITLAADGSATSTWTAAEDQRRNQTGKWVEADGKVTIEWHNGWREVIEASGEAFVKKAFAPKMKLEDEPANSSPAVKVDAIP